jgi:hypothetical protein
MMLRMESEAYTSAHPECDGHHDGFGRQDSPLDEDLHSTDDAIALPEHPAHPTAAPGGVQPREKGRSGRPPARRVSPSRVVNRTGAVRPRIVIALLVLAVLVGALDAWVYRDQLNPDGISYLDIGNAYFSAHFDAAVNLYWSPLYSLLLGGVLALVPETISSEAPVVHVCNFAIYCAAVGSFTVLVRELLRYREAVWTTTDPAPLRPIGVWATGLLGFTWAMTKLIGLGVVSPDLLVAALWFLSTALLLRSLRAPGSTPTLVALGSVLGLAYLAKAATLTLAPVFLAVVATTPGAGNRFRRVAVVAAALIAVSMPFVVALSVKNESPTFGRSGELNYAWWVNGVPRFVYLPDSARDDGLRHPPRRISNHPPAFAFAEPVPGTNPLWYDPVYWYDGVKVEFDFRAQVRQTLDSASLYRQLLQDSPGEKLALGFGALVLCALSSQIRPMVLLAYLRFILPSVAGLLVYATVNVSTRYIAAFVSVLTVGLFSALPEPRGTPARRAYAVVLVAVLVAGWAPVLRTSLRGAFGEDPTVEAIQTRGAQEKQAALALTRRGFGRGDRLAYVGGQKSILDSVFPRLARVRVVAAVTHPPARWQLSPQLERALRANGVKAVVARDVIAAGRSSRWQELGDSRYYLHTL